MLVSGHSAAQAEELTGTLLKVKELGYITIGHREASVPFSYLDDNRQPVGFAIDICARIVDAVKRELKLDKLEVRYQLVTASSRIPLLANGTIDLECGNTTNNAERQKQVWYTNTHFLTASRFLSKVESKIGSISDLKGKTIVSPAGSTNIKQALEFNSRLNLGMTIVPAQDQGEAFLMVETGRAAAFVQDDVILAGLIAISKDPKAYVISDDAFSKPEPYGIMLRKDDVAFKAIADAATAALYRSPEGAALYAKWFTQAIPPKGINLNIPMGPALKRAFENPTDSPDPAAY
jgi:glutamate/aspartate transport system substrate-binding protein